MSRRVSNQTAKAPSAPRPIAVDLFAGAGGLALGFEQAGFDVLASVEYDPVHAAVHEFNFPYTKVVCADVAKLSGDALLNAVSEGWRLHNRPGAFDGELDVVFGGPPCQGFSTIGKRLVEDERNALVFHFFRLVTEIKPRYFVMENVPGMAIGGHSGILARLVEEFSTAGYTITWPPQILNAADFGVPQDRRRLFLLGSRAGEPLARYPVPFVRRGDGRTSRTSSVVRSFIDPQTQLALASDIDLQRGPTVAEALGDLPDLDGFEALRDTDVVILSDAQLKRQEGLASDYAKRLRGLLKDSRDLSYPRRWNPTMLTSSMRTEHTDLSVARFASTVPGDTEPVSRFLRLPPDGLCNTLRAGTGSERGAFTSPRPIHPTLPRVISVREAARLHSFPDWFRFHQTKWHGFRQIGNAVPPLLGRAVGESFRSALGLNVLKPKEAISLGDERLLELSMADAALYFKAHVDSIPKPRSRKSRPMIASAD